MVEIVIEKNEADQRLDRFLKKYFRKASLSHIYKMIRKDVKVNGRREKNDTLLREGDKVALYISNDEFDELRGSRNVSAAPKRFGIAFEDEDILIAEKPFGLLTHGDANEKKNTLQNQVESYLIAAGSYDPRAEKTFVPSPVNRLDRNTTGLVIFGKNAGALREYSKLIRERGGIRKYYFTIIAGEIGREIVLHGEMKKDERTNTVKVSRVCMGESPEDVSREGALGTKRMITVARPIFSAKGYTLVEAELVTGRTHQIRAQLAAEGYPIIGDRKYGDRRVNQSIKSRFGITTQLLHAGRLEFSAGHNSGLVVKAELPEMFNKVLQGIFGKKAAAGEYI